MEDLLYEGEEFFDDRPLREIDEERDFEEDLPKYEIGGYKQEVAYATGGPTDIVEGISKTAQRIIRSGKEEAVRRCREILNEKLYDSLDTRTKDRALAKIRETKEISLFNLELLVLACIYISQEKRKNFRIFLQKYSKEDTSDIDVLRYVRFLSSKK